MGTSVDANGRSILHKGHGMTHTCAVPDVCKTPSPGGPIPIPYVNVAMDSNLADGASTVKIEGNPVAKVTSKIATSMGDEPGTAGGVISSKFKGAMTWKMGSLDVKAEGKSVVRFLDTAFHNGNTFNTSFINVGGTGFAYGDDAPCEACKQPAEKHRVHETDQVRASVAKLIKRLNELLDAQRESLDAALVAKTKKRILNVNMAAIKKDVGAARFKEMLKAQENALEAANDALSGNHVLTLDEHTETYTYGYMLGVCLCKCGQKALASCSGDPTPGFKTAVSDSGFELGPDMPALSARQEANVASRGTGHKWSCAAPKLINALGAHKPKTIVEQFYQPGGGIMATVEWPAKARKAKPAETPPAEGPPAEPTASPPVPEMRQKSMGASFPRKEGVTIEYWRGDGDVGEMVEEVFGSGETAPSCDRCKVNLPEMLCKIQEPCPGQE